jgi:hypothetical protein
MRARALLAALVVVGCAGGPKDTLDPSHEVHVGDAGAGQAEGYAYVVRRPLVALALAEARNIGDEEARRALDRAADGAASCFRRFSREGKLSSGAARIILPVDDGGVVGQPLVTFSAAQGAAVQGMLCVVATLRMDGFSPTAPGGPQRALAVEAAWGPDVSAQTAPTAPAPP